MIGFVTMGQLLQIDDEDLKKGGQKWQNQY